MPKLNSLMYALPLFFYVCQLYTRVYALTCSECPTHSLTLGATLCRYNEVVSGVSLDLLRKGDDGHPIMGTGGRVVTVDQVGVR